jgi:hypothetical protein
MFSKLVDEAIAKNKSSSLNCILINEDLLFESAKEESGYNSLSRDDFRSSIERFIDDRPIDEDLQIVNGALYACQVVANHCFVGEFDENTDQSFSHEWIIEKNLPNCEFSVVIKKE